MKTTIKREREIKRGIKKKHTSKMCVVFSLLFFTKKNNIEIERRKNANLSGRISKVRALESDNENMKTLLNVDKKKILSNNKQRKRYISVCIKRNALELNMKNKRRKKSDMKSK